MHSSIELTSNAFSSILEHLVDIEERKDEIINELSGEVITLCKHYSTCLNTYLKRLEELIICARIIDNPAPENLMLINHLPYVIIGSKVTLESKVGLDTHFYKIVSPFNASNSEEDLSCLSPLGKELMLKGVGDAIETNFQEEIGLYKIKSIIYN